ncbi:hypothetical protein CF336_g410 [Tilletia laevis]|uniref:Uncharacterized protein n=1 Tax=Tilletia caries TaxID=13290 RepID=A0A8T8SDU1_9BASI|nr:hypothetical protein CF335_g9232 [Tilletia laevis]KAE8200996.1 hypothetical protein CF336_g410 [Tilletia laevis]KAE8237930.1 hypothetical protein A4X03_0g9002 [Tilletia caries]
MKRRSFPPSTFAAAATDGFSSRIPEPMASTAFASATTNRPRSTDNSGMPMPSNSPFASRIIGAGSRPKHPRPPPPPAALSSLFSSSSSGSMIGAACMV